MKTNNNKIVAFGEWLTSNGYVPYREILNLDVLKKIVLLTDKEIKANDKLQQPFIKAHRALYRMWAKTITTN